MSKAIFGKPEYEKTFDTEYGTFTLRRPSLYLKAEMHKAVARMLGGVDVDWAGALDVFQMAQIQIYACTDEQIRKGEVDHPAGWPEGFSWKKCFDLDFAREISTKHKEWLDSFRNTVSDNGDKEAGVGGGQESGLPTESETGNVSDRSPVASAR